MDQTLQKSFDQTNGWTIKKLVGIALVLFGVVVLGGNYFILTFIGSSEAQSDEVGKASLQTSEQMEQLGIQIAKLKNQHLLLLVEAQNLVVNSISVKNNVFLYVNQVVEESQNMDSSYQVLLASLERIKQAWPKDQDTEKLKVVESNITIIGDIIAELKETSSPNQLEEMSEDVDSISTILVETSIDIKSGYTEKIQLATDFMQEKSIETLKMAKSSGEASALTSNLMRVQEKLILSISLVTLVMLGIIWIIISKLIINPIKVIINSITELAKGNLTARCEISGRTELSNLADSLNAMGLNLHNLVNLVSAIGTNVQESSRQLSKRSQLASTDMSTQNAETTQIAVAVEELINSTSSVMDISSTATTDADTVSMQADSSSSAVSAVNESIRNLASEIDSATTVIDKLADESEKIGSVLDVIRGVSDQINLLALNAAIEAARAGEYGRGFAVVADEVRTLASQTQASTEEIQKMIQKLQTGSSEAVKVMKTGSQQASESVNMGNNAVTAIKETTYLISSINNLTKQIASSCKDQKEVVERVNLNVLKINTLSETTTQGAADNLSAASELEELSSDLQKAISKFHL